MEVLGQLEHRQLALVGGRSGRSSRFWCMRIARSISPWRRNRLPSAKCRSIVCGSTLTTSMNDSIALSGCSFSRKLRPRKYDSGRARDSRNRCLMSMRAAIQPSAKNSDRERQQPPELDFHGRRERASARVDRMPRPRRPSPATLLLAQARAVGACSRAVRSNTGEQTRDDAGGKGQQKQNDQRRLPGKPVVETQRHQVGILQRQQQQRREYRDANRPAGERHQGRPPRSAIQFFLKSTRSRNSLPALKCGTCFSGTCTFSPDLGLRPIARRPVVEAEAAEAADLDAIALRQSSRTSHRASSSPRNPASLATKLREPRRQAGDQLRFGHLRRYRLGLAVLVVELGLQQRAKVGRAGAAPSSSADSCAASLPAVVGTDPWP